jgi:6-pyruvoyltetrahydropterin/6-carboxytetrahydropterin synthase
VTGSYRVSVSKDYLVFAAAHFITFRGHQCEPLHGHNYRVSVTVEGALDPECRFVLDFSVLKKTLRRLVDAIDHRVLLPTRSPKLAYEEADGRVTVLYFGSPLYVFPATDCAMLPIENTTAELIASHLAEQLLGELRAAGYDALTLLELEVEENVGQSATYRADLAGRGA